MVSLLSLSLDEIKNIVVEMGFKSFRGEQLYKALIKGIKVDKITTLSKDFLTMMSQRYDLEPIKVKTVQQSEDGTIKFASTLSDGNIIETVIMDYKYGSTVCVSTQVGCRMGCKFCASTRNGLVRNLDAGEILAQVIEAGVLKGERVSNIVLMGCGEPLDNYANVVRFIRLANAKEGLNISIRHISLSTCGLVDKILKLADEGLGINLTISLHASNDEVRKSIMPIANKYTIKEILDACDYYFEKTKRRIYFEYTLTTANDDLKYADELSGLLRGRVCHVNVIRLNDATGKLTPSDKAKQFVARLNKNNISATLRRTLGSDIDGACGQLRARLEDEV